LSSVEVKTEKQGAPVMTILISPEMVAAKVKAVITK